MWWKILYRWAVGAGEVWYGLAPMMIWYGMVWYHTHKQTGPQLRKGMTPLRSSQAVEDELVLILAFAHCRRIPGSSCPAHSLSHHGQPAHTMGQPAHTMGQPAHTRSHHGCSHMGQPAHTWASPLTPWASPLTHGPARSHHGPARSHHGPARSHHGPARSHMGCMVVYGMVPVWYQYHTIPYPCQHNPRKVLYHPHFHAHRAFLRCPVMC